MAIVFRGAGTGVGASSGNVTPTLPTGTIENDILVLLVEQRDNVVSTVSGYTEKSANNSGTGDRYAVFWKRAGASETDPPVTHTGGGSIAAVVIGFSGCVTTGDPFNAALATTTTPASGTITANEITTTVANSMVIFSYHYGQGAGTQGVFNIPTGMT